MPQAVFGLVRLFRFTFIMGLHEIIRIFDAIFYANGRILFGVRTGRQEWQKAGQECGSGTPISSSATRDSFGKHEDYSTETSDNGLRTDHNHGPRRADVCFFEKEICRLRKNGPLFVPYKWVIKLFC